MYIPQNSWSSFVLASFPGPAQFSIAFLFAQNEASFIPSVFLLNPYFWEFLYCPIIRWNHSNVGRAWTGQQFNDSTYYVCCTVGRCTQVCTSTWHVHVASFPGSPLALMKSVFTFRHGEGRAWEWGYTHLTCTCITYVPVAWFLGLPCFSPLIRLHVSYIPVLFANQRTKSR